MRKHDNTLKRMKRDLKEGASDALVIVLLQLNERCYQARGYSHTELGLECVSFCGHHIPHHLHLIFRPVILIPTHVSLTEVPIKAPPSIRAIGIVIAIDMIYCCETASTSAYL